MKTSRFRKCISKSRRGFTLIELLAVITVIVILMALTLPAFDNLGRGSAVRTAATQIVSVMTFARQEAVLSGVNTYVIFPGGEKEIYQGRDPEHREKAFRSYAVYSEKKGYIRNWTYLPKGVLFIPSKSEFPDIDASGDSIIRDTKSIFTSGVSGGIEDKVTLALPFPDDTENLKTLRVIGYSPDGATFSVDGNLRGPDAELYLSEGYTEFEGTDDINPEYRSVTDSSLYAITLNPLTGQSRILDLRYF